MSQLGSKADFEGMSASDARRVIGQTPTSAKCHQEIWTLKRYSGPVTKVPKMRRGNDVDVSTLVSRTNLKDKEELQ